MESPDYGAAIHPSNARCATGAGTWARRAQLLEYALLAQGTNARSDSASEESRRKLLWGSRDR